MARRPVDLDALVAGVLGGDRATLARAITLVESSRADHRALASALVERLLPRTGGAHRVGVSGVPGVGKSTFLEAVGMARIDAGQRVAVLAIDPSSGVSGGSILGDKTRMGRLATHPAAFVRPSPTGGALGGVHRATQQAILLCEAAGYDLVLVETVGVGQSETAVADLTDFFLVLMLPGAGDELQGIKKGIIELADMIAINKADGDGAARARAAAVDYRAALHILAPASPLWTPPVITVSGLTGEGLDTLWEHVCDHHARLEAKGEISARRRGQDIKWMWAMIEERIHRRLHGDADLRAHIRALEEKVREGTLPPTSAADEIAGILGL